MPYKELDLDRVMALTKEERAYMAGFFDGEGCVSMSVVREVETICVLTISQKRVAILSWFHETFGGSLFIRLKKGQNTELGIWSVGKAETILMFYRIVKPYLRIKAEEFALIAVVLDNPVTDAEETKNVMQLVRTIRAEQDRPIAVGE